MIQSGDLIAQRSRGLLDDLIRDVTGETWDHVAVVWVPQTGAAPMVFQAHHGSGLSCVPLSTIGAFDLISIGTSLSAAAVAATQAAIGQRYSILDAVEAGLRFRPTNGGHICSEYAAHILSINGQLPMAWMNRAVTPGQLVEYFLDRGCTLKSVSS